MKLKWMIVSLIGLLAFLAVGFLWETRVKSIGDFPGLYLAECKFATEELVLKGDGTFEQCVALKNTGKINIARGFWTFDTADSYVRFNENFMNVMDGFQKLNPNYAGSVGDTVLPARWSCGKIQIGVAEGVVYTKTNRGSQ